RARGFDREVGARRILVGHLDEVLRDRVRLALVPRLEPDARPRALLGALLPRLARLRERVDVLAGGGERLGLVAQPETRAARPRRQLLRDRGTARLFVEELRDRQARILAHEEF